jgi:hypothetical protein
MWNRGVDAYAWPVNLIILQSDRHTLGVNRSAHVRQSAVFISPSPNPAFTTK